MFDRGSRKNQQGARVALTDATLIKPDHYQGHRQDYCRDHRQDQRHDYHHGCRQDQRQDLRHGHRQDHCWDYCQKYDHDDHHNHHHDHHDDHQDGEVYCLNSMVGGVRGEYSKAWFNPTHFGSFALFSFRSRRRRR